MHVLLTVATAAAFTGLLMAQQAPALTADVAQQAMRALPALPVPVDQLKVTDTSNSRAAVHSEAGV